MTTTKTPGLTLLLLFASSVAAQEASVYGVTQGINCFGKEYVCVGPLNYKHCEWDAQGNTYAAGNVIQCPSNHRCVNDGVEMCIPLKLSTTAPQAAPLITSEQTHVNSISTEDPIKIIPLKWESTSAIPETTIDVVVHKELSIIPVVTTTAADGSIWTTFLTENPNAYNTLGSQLADTNIPFTTRSALETTTNAIIETTTFQEGTTIPSGIYTTLTPIISDDSSLPVKSNNHLEAGSIVDITHISIDEIALKNQASETTTIRNIPSDPNFTDNYYSTISTPESPGSITEIYPRTTITESVGQYVPFETETPIFTNPTIFPEGSTGTSPIIEPLETTTLIEQTIAFDSNTPVNLSESNIQNKTPTAVPNSPINGNASTHPSTLISNSLPVEHNPQVEPNIPIELSSSADPNATTTPGDEINTVIPNVSSVPSTPASSSLPVEQNSPVVSSVPTTQASSSFPAEHNSPVDPNISVYLSSSTDPNATTIPVDQTNTIIPNPSSVPSTPASSSLPVEQNSPVVSSDHTTLASSSFPVEHNSPVDPNISNYLSSSTDPNTTTIPVDQTNTIIPNPSSVPSTPASSSLPVEQNSPVDPNSPIDLSSSTDPNATTIPVDQIIPNIQSISSDSMKPASSSSPVKPTSSLVSSDPSTLASSNLPVEHNSPVDPNISIYLSSSTDSNATTIPVDQTNTIIPKPSSVPSSPASSSLPVEQNSPVDPNNPIDLSQTNPNIPSISSDSRKPASSSLPVKPISLVVSSDFSLSSNLPVEYNSPVDPTNLIDLSSSTDSTTATIPTDQTNTAVSSLPSNSPVNPNNPIDLSSSTDPNATTIPVNQTIINIQSTSSDSTKPASSTLPVEPISSVISSDLSALTSSNLPVEHNSPVDPNSPIDLSSPTDPNATTFPVDQIIPNIQSLSSDSMKPASSSSPVKPTSSLVSSDPSTLASSNLPVEHNSPVDPKMPIDLNSSTGPNAISIPVDQSNIIITSASSDPSAPESSLLPVEHNSPIDSNIPIELSAKPNATSIPVEKTKATIPSIASDPSPAISRAPVKSNSSPSASPSLVFQHNSPLEDTNQLGVSSPVASANPILQVELKVPVLAGEAVENYVPSRNQPGVPKAPITSNSPVNITGSISYTTSTNLHHVNPKSSTVNPNTPISPKIRINSDANQPANINSPTDSSGSAGPNKLVAHTSAIHSSDLHTGLPKWYLYSRSKGSNTNEEANNGMVFLPKHPLGSRRPTSTKKPNHQETIEAESSETNSSKSVLKEGGSIEETSNSNSKNSKRQKNSQNNKRKEETVEKETVEKESSEISLPEKRQNKDTSVENKSGTNSKESKDSKDFQEEKVKVESKPDDEEDESASSEQKELIKKILKKIKDSKCDEDDVYPDPKDCKKYYRCVKKNHKTKITHLRCESGDRFDSDKLKCVDKRKAKCFSKEDFIEEFA